MKRRKFIRNSVVLASTGGAVTLCSTRSKNQQENTEVLRAFIISDAHIGWKGKAQPSIQQQYEAVQNIKSKFPDLDLVFDTGDIHHGNLNQKERMVARKQWLEKIANQFPLSLFHYIPGNHELGRGVDDTELTASKIGSQNFKPYYSFDLNGIHFISLPQLLDTILINKESLNWLSQDLELNKKKTTLIFSHNSLRNTTFSNGESGYRETVNSDEVFKQINKHNNVIAWFHGHNHQYEIVKKHQRLYVSNGRIGGFNPPESWGPFGQGHLGGIYFELSKNSLKVEGYSASKNDFLSNLGYPNLSKTLTLKTTFSPKREMNYYCGLGCLTSNLSLKTYNHYLSHNKSEMYFDQLGIDLINDNNDFRYSNDLYFAGKKRDKVIGIEILPAKIKKQATSSGLVIENLSNSDEITIKLPKVGKKRNNQLTRPSYYRCSPGDSYVVDIEFDQKNSDQYQNISLLEVDILNEKHEPVSQLKSVPLEIINFRTTKKIDIPKSLQTKDKHSRFYLKLIVKLRRFPKTFIIRSLSLRLVSMYKNQQPIISIDDNSFIADTNRPIPFKPSTDNIIKLTSSHGINTLLIKTPNVKWQVRNAQAVIEKNTINILGYRYPELNSKAIILTPVHRHENYIYMTENVSKFNIKYLNNKIILSVNETLEDGIIYLKCINEPIRIVGLALINKSVDILKYKLLQKNVSLTF